MKLILSNGTIIECTVDEYEELYTRGLIDKNVAESIKKESEDLVFSESTRCVPLYGCRMKVTKNELVQDEEGKVFVRDF